MSNRVVKDKIWTSPTIAAMEDVWAQLAFPWFLLLADDWGCFEVNPVVVAIEIV